MDSLFTQTTALLTTEYISLYTSEQLTSKLSKVRLITGAQFKQANQSYALTGTWEQVNGAFDLLKRWHDDPNEECNERTEKATRQVVPCRKKGRGSIDTTKGQAENKQYERTEKSESGTILKNNVLGRDDEKSEESSQNFEKHCERKETCLKRYNEIVSLANKAIIEKGSCDVIKPSINSVMKERKPNDTFIQNFKRKNALLEVKRSHVQFCQDNQKLAKDAPLESDESDISCGTPSITDGLESDINFHDNNDSSKENKNTNAVSFVLDENKEKDGLTSGKKTTRKPGDEGYWSRVKIANYNEKHNCTKCGVVLKSRKRYMEHLRRIHIKEYRCDVCERRFGYPTDLNRHKCPGVPDPNNEHKGKGGRPKKEKAPTFLPCPECDYIGTSKKRFNGHVMRTHRLSFACDQCDKMFGFSRDLQRHKGSVHADVSHFCDKCSKSYKSKAVFDEHMKTHEEGYVKPKFQCEVCHKTFTTKYALASHIKTEHLGMRRTFLCQICGKKFNQRNSYKQHSNAHAGIKPYKCEICGKAFTYHKSLKEHKFMHDTLRRFQCQLCDKKFRQRTTLQIHMKVHKTIKDHICKTCGKGFSQKPALERHERIHTGIKPYTCIPCQRTFGDASTIRRHMLSIHHKDETNWREDVICTLKRKTDYYVLGGSGQNRTYNRTKSYSAHLSRTKNRKSNTQNVMVSESNPILFNTQAQCSLACKMDSSLNGTILNHTQAGQPQTIQTGSIFAVTSNIAQSSTLQNASMPLIINVSNSGSGTDFSLLSQTTSQLQSTAAAAKGAEMSVSVQTPCTRGLENATLTPVAVITELPQHTPISSLSTSSSSATTAGAAVDNTGAIGQPVNSVWGYIGYPTYYSCPTVTVTQSQSPQ